MTFSDEAKLRQEISTTWRLYELEREHNAKLKQHDDVLRQAKEALMAVSPLMIPGVTWSCATGTMIKGMVLEAVEAINKELK